MFSLLLFFVEFFFFGGGGGGGGGERDTSVLLIILIWENSYDRSNSRIITNKKIDFFFGKHEPVKLSLLGIKLIDFVM